ncbi:hypothetical protein CJ030_MR7G024262 [Morella rubra]|uniref:Uncharacterized protein n=1 Tax=Morella rubra TaxID=262757 RepID=A0A6A1V9Q9_9ROSI|nr:hypothetical protein CJ030_MR7G024262 [Morella rubra]
MSFIRNFRIESKEFQVSISARGVVKFSEWSLKSMNIVHMGKFGVCWLVNMSHSLLKAGTTSDFSSKFNESGCGFLAQRCLNKGGRYVAIVEYGGGRKVGAVMVPEGRYAHGWQILNCVFQEAVSHFGSLQSQVAPLRSPSTRPKVSFSDAVVGDQKLAGVEFSSGVEFGNGATCVALKENVPCSALHANLVADVTAPNKGILIASADSSRGEKLADLVSSSKMVSYTEVWSQVVGLRRQVERLEHLLTHWGADDPAPLTMKCPVCGFRLQAHQTSRLFKDAIGPLAAGDSPLEVPKVQGKPLANGPNNHDLGSGFSSIVQTHEANVHSSGAKGLVGGFPVLDKEVPLVGGPTLGAGSVSEILPERSPEVDKLSVPCEVHCEMLGLGSKVSREIGMAQLLSLDVPAMMEGISQSFERQEVAPSGILVGRAPLASQTFVGGSLGASSKSHMLSTA